MTQTPTGDRVRLEVTGMTCGNCVAHVREALADVDGVRAVDVDLESGRADVAGGGLDRGALIAAIRAAGYDVEGGAPERR